MTNLRCLKTPQNTQLSFAEPIQTGRSLTEMLGVLAVMGIIILTGVKMFHSAMDRHQANELIYEAQKRATSVAAQIMGGKDKSDLSVADFPDPEGHTFGVEQNPQNEKQFNITITGVKTEVCQKMKTIVGLGTTVQLISDDCTVLTFNDDLSKTSQEQCLAAHKIWCAETGVCSDSSLCCFAGNCAASNCPSGAQANGTGGSTGVFVAGTECKCETAGYVYNGDTCVEQPSGCTMASLTTNECGKGYYCAVSYTTANLNPELNETPNTEEEQCYQGLTGTCKVLSASAPSAARMEVLKAAGFKSTFVMGGKMNWWSGVSWCLGQGKHLIDVADIECYPDGQTLVTSGSGKGLCCKRGKLCEDVWEESWNRDQMVSGRENDIAQFSDKMIALRKAYGTNNAALTFWTGSSSLGNGSSNSCYAFRIGANYGTASNPLKSSGYYVVCQ